MVIVKMPEHIKPRFSRYIGIDYSGAEAYGDGFIAAPGDDGPLSRKAGRTKLTGRKKTTKHGKTA